MKMRSRGGLAAAAAVSMAVGMIGLGAGSAAAVPQYTEPNLVRTLNCDSLSPWPQAPLKMRVEVYNRIQNSADGLPGPTIALIASNRAQPGPLEYTSEVTVTWRNLATGRSGRVFVPSRSRLPAWEVDLHPGRGPVAFTIKQRIGAMAFVPMVNPQFSRCGGRASAV